ncbi:MAG: CBS domain-containing protein [Micromonosporaceae bacterium]
MTRDVATVRTDTPYREIVDLIAGRGVGAVPVLDAVGEVVGVVSEADLLHKIESSGIWGTSMSWLRRRAARREAHRRVARDLISRPPFVVEPALPIPAAAKVMKIARVRRLPVVNRTGRLVGIVSRRDLLGVFLRPDDQVRAEVVREVVRPVLSATDEQVQVRVADGVVTLSGAVERRSLVPIADQMTRSVNGVVDVVNELGYDIDDRHVGRPPHLAGAWGAY